MIKALKCVIAVLLDLLVLVMLCIPLVIAFVPVVLLAIFFGFLFVLGFVWGWSHDVETPDNDLDVF